MFFPWVGTFEKICLADKFLYDDDVQYPKGTFTNRVQIKTAKGLEWLTVPLRKFVHTTQTRFIQIDNSQDWRRNHLVRFYQHYKAAPYRNDALQLMEAVYSSDYELILDLAIASVNCACSYLGIEPRIGFELTSTFNVQTKKSERIRDLAVKANAAKYVCGAGKQNVGGRYLKHEMLEKAGVSVEYITYRKQPYPQLFGDFSPFVSILDLIANAGLASQNYLNPNSKSWRLFTHLSCKSL